MTNNYSPQMLAMALGLAWSGSAIAVNPPSIAQTLTDGETYLMMNHARPAMYMTRTSWDGAYYLMGYEAWKNNTGAWQPIEFEARKNSDGTWSFVYVEEEPRNPGEEGSMFLNYLGIPAGSGNLKAIKEMELEDVPLKWTVTAGDYDNYYKLYPGENNPNTLVKDHPLHLNGGGEYAIIYYEGNGWGFDIYGGIKYNEDEEPVYENPASDILFPVFNNYEQTNWCFIHKDDIEGYNHRAEAYSLIKDLEDNYAELEGYEEGFKSLIATVSAIYEAEDGNLDDIKALAAAKKALYDALENAILLNDTGDAALQSAIDKATATFNTSDELTAINNANEALASALKIYLSGSGDFTSYGKNMSFEDLSAQNGAETSGVVDAPAGWNLYINGKQCVTAADLKSAGIGAWCGINADSDGDKDGKYAFGIWNSGMPEVELSQTIEGLENGTYLISAGVMVGGNGNGSRMTTQRLFGNLNSALFGWESDYNKEYLNPAEVYEYAELSEMTTDTWLQDMSVSAYVYDGTLTFGFRTNGKWQAVAGRTGGNGAGGDGWFKIDNFRIQYMGYDPSDGDNILSYYQNLLSDFAEETMQTSVAEKIETLLDLSPANQEEMNAAILECRDYITVVKASIDAYAKMYSYLDDCMMKIDEYSDYNGIGEYEKAVLEAMDALDAGELDEAGLAAMRTSLEEALNTLLLSGVFEGKDVTNLIVNPSFEDITGQSGNSGGVENAPYGWNLYLNGELCKTNSDINAQGVTGWCAINYGDDISGKGLYDENNELITGQPTEGDHLWGIWNQDIPEVELSQTIEGLPAGTYVMTADVMIEWNWAGDCMTTQRIFANDAVCMYGWPDYYLKNATPDMLAAIEADRKAGFYIDIDDFTEEEVEEEAEEEAVTRAVDDEEIDGYRLMNYARYSYDNVPETSLLHTLTLKFVVGDDGKAKIGFRSNNINRNGEAVTSGKGWFKVDNFTLYYDSQKVPTAVESIKTTSTASAIYSLDGIRLSAPQKGINIIRKDGKTIKLIIK